MTRASSSASGSTAASASTSASASAFVREAACRSGDYEQAMSFAGHFLRRRDLGSYEEIPLYYAWQRLYAAANANLETDLLEETQKSLSRRKQFRMEPRMGLPPKAKESEIIKQRESALASSYLRNSSKKSRSDAQGTRPAAAVATAVTAAAAGDWAFK